MITIICWMLWGIMYLILKLSLIFL